MAKFEIQTPDGKIYEVEGAHDEHGALQALQTHLGQRRQAYSSPVGPSGTIEVELPGGTIAEFPEGTSRDVMPSALQKRFGTQQQLTPAQQGQN